MGTSHHHGTRGRAGHPVHARLRIARVGAAAGAPDSLLTELSAAGIAGIVAPQGAFYLYLDVAHLTDDSLAFCVRLLENTGVAAAPGLDFDRSGVMDRCACRLR